MFVSRCHFCSCAKLAVNTFGLAWCLAFGVCCLLPAAQEPGYLEAGMLECWDAGMLGCWDTWMFECLGALVSYRSSLFGICSLALSWDMAARWFGCSFALWNICAATLFTIFSVIYCWQFMLSLCIFRFLYLVSSCTLIYWYWCVLLWAYVEPSVHVYCPYWNGPTHAHPLWCVMYIRSQTSCERSFWQCCWKFEKISYFF